MCFGAALMGRKWRSLCGYRAKLSNRPSPNAIARTFSPESIFICIGNWLLHHEPLEDNVETIFAVSFFVFVFDCELLFKSLRHHFIVVLKPRLIKSLSKSGKKISRSRVWLNLLLNKVFSCGLLISSSYLTPPCRVKSFRIYFYQRTAVPVHMLK